MPLIIRLFATSLFVVIAFGMIVRGDDSGSDKKATDTPRKIVYLCNGTGSMINKMATLKDELDKSITELKPNQSFNIIFFSPIGTQIFQKGLVAATAANKHKMGDFLNGITATGSADPIPALTDALKLKPELLYFLTDAGDFDTSGFLDAVKKYNGDHKIKINTVMYTEDKADRERHADAEALLKKIATDNGGSFRAVVP